MRQRGVLVTARQEQQNSTPISAIGKTRLILRVVLIALSKGFVILGGLGGSGESDLGTHDQAVA